VAVFKCVAHTVFTFMFMASYAGLTPCMFKRSCVFMAMCAVYVHAHVPHVSQV
jgi:hypothetical protein